MTRLCIIHYHIHWQILVFVKGHCINACVSLSQAVQYEMKLVSIYGSAVWGSWLLQQDVMRLLACAV